MNKQAKEVILTPEQAELVQQKLTKGYALVPIVSTTTEQPQEEQQTVTAKRHRRRPSFLAEHLIQLPPALKTDSHDEADDDKQEQSRKVTVFRRRPSRSQEMLIQSTAPSSPPATSWSQRRKRGKSASGFSPQTTPPQAPITPEPQQQLQNVKAELPSPLQTVAEEMHEELPAPEMPHKQEIVIVPLSEHNGKGHETAGIAAKSELPTTHKEEQGDRKEKRTRVHRRTEVAPESGDENSAESDYDKELRWQRKRSLPQQIRIVPLSKKRTRKQTQQAELPPPQLEQQQQQQQSVTSTRVFFAFNSLILQNKNTLSNNTSWLLRLSCDVTSFLLSCHARVYPEGYIVVTVVLLGGAKGVVGRSSGVSCLPCAYLSITSRTCDIESVISRS